MQDETTSGWWIHERKADFMRYQGLVIAWLAVVAVGSSALGNEMGWSQINQKNGVVVWQKTIPGSRMMAFRGLKRLKVPIAKVAYVLTNADVEQKKRWIDMVKDFRVVEKITPQINISYSSYDLPFPLDDRDFVIKSTQIADRANRRLTIELKSVEHAQYPAIRSAGVRAQLFASSFILQDAGAEGTDVTCEIHTDPMGWLPAWVVNVINRNWPVNTLSRLEEEALKPDTKDHPYTIEQLAIQPPNP